MKRKCSNRGVELNLEITAGCNNRNVYRHGRLIG